MNVNKVFDKWLLLVIVILTASVLVLGYSVYRLNRQLQQFLPQTSLNSSESKNASGEKEGAGSSFPSDSSFPRVAPDPWAPSPYDPSTWDPFRELAEMQERMDDLFNNAFERFQRSPRFGGLVKELDFSPDMDMTENETQYVIRLDVPGADAANLQVKLDGNTLTISGTREKDEESQEPGRAIKRERRIGQFQRTVHFPSPVKPGSLKTDYKDGVLTITVDKDKNL